MTYFDLINNAIDLCITVDSTTGMAYLEPPYRMLLREADLIHPEIIEPEELYELLKLEVKKQNAKVNKSYAVSEWLHDIITQTVDPAMTQEENELVKNLLEYMRKNEELKSDEQKRSAEDGV